MLKPLIMFKTLLTPQTLVLALAGLTPSLTFADEVTDLQQELFPVASQASFKGPDKHFTGEVQIDLLFPASETTSYSGASVQFAPGARTAWHSHPAGQHMIITAGRGITETRDGKVIHLLKGDALWCPPGTDHWHGARPDSGMTHIVITGSVGEDSVVWEEKVTDDTYQASFKK